MIKACQCGYLYDSFPVVSHGSFLFHWDGYVSTLTEDLPEGLLEPNCGQASRACCFALCRATIAAPILSTVYDL